MAKDGVESENSGKRSVITDLIRIKKDEIRDTQEKLREVAQKSSKVRDDDGDDDDDNRPKLIDDKGGFRKEIAKVRSIVAAKVYNATIVRLEKLVERIQSRTDKVKAEGGITTTAQGFVDAAKINISDAKAHIVLMQSADISTSTASTTARANFENVKDEAKIAKKLLQDAKQNLQKAVNALARLNKEIKSNNATSTPATTTPATN